MPTGELNALLPTIQAAHGTPPRAHWTSPAGLVKAVGAIAGAAVCVGAGALGRDLYEMHRSLPRSPERRLLPPPAPATLPAPAPANEARDALPAVRVAAEPALRRRLDEPAWVDEFYGDVILLASELTPASAPAPDLTWTQAYEALPPPESAAVAAHASDENAAYGVQPVAPFDVIAELGNTTDFTWRRFPGPTSLFGASGLPDQKWARQNLYSGTCWALGGLKAVAAKNPHWVASLFRDVGPGPNGTHLYQVGLAPQTGGGARHWVKVDDQFLLDSAGESLAAHIPVDESTGKGVIFPALFEKALMKEMDLEDVLSNNRPPGLGYFTGNGGGGFEGMQALTGHAVATLETDMLSPLDNVPACADDDDEGCISLGSLLTLENLPNANLRFALDLLPRGDFAAMLRFKGSDALGGFLYYNSSFDPQVGDEQVVDGRWDLGQGYSATYVNGTLGLDSGEFLHLVGPNGFAMFSFPAHAYAVIEANETHLTLSNPAGSNVIRQAKGGVNDTDPDAATLPLAVAVLLVDRFWIGPVG